MAVMEVEVEVECIWTHMETNGWFFSMRLRQRRRKEMAEMP